MSQSALPTRHAEQVAGAVLFADVIGFGQLSRDLGTETAYLMVTRCLRLLDGIARKHGGSVDKYLGDKLIAVFGYPVPLEHPSRAAADAALEMRERVVDYNREADVPLPLGIHIGLNTGSFVAGDVRGGPVAREFNVLGDTVNTAARLNSRASDGQILVGRLTWEETGDRFAYRTLEPLTLKGKAKPVPAYELVAAHEVPTQGRLGFDEFIFASLVGREQELGRLTRWAERVARGRGGLVILEGEEGIGKSRLLAELGASEALDKLDTVQLRISAADHERPRRTIVRLLSAWAGIGVGDTADERRAKLTAALARRSTATEVQAIAPWLAALLDAPLPGAAGRRVRELPAAEREARTREAVVRVFCPDAAAGPLLLLLEDAQWLDPESLSLLEALLDAAEDRPTLFIASQRPEGEAAERLRARVAALSAEAAEAIELGPLGDAEAGRLVTAVAGRGVVDDETVALVVERSSGNPARLIMASFLAPALRREREQEAGRGRTSETERRRATVLFADISGFTSMTEQLGAQAAYPVVSAALDELDAVARAHGGTVDKHHGDCVMALFGVPEAIEDAPRAAVNAAIDMRRRIQAFNDERGLEQRLDVHTGIATGLGIAGDISGPMIREFAVMGDHVDLADDLTHAATSGEIYVDPETHRFTSETFDYRPAQPLELDDGAEPIPAWEVLSTAPHLHRARFGVGRRIASELVGREEELAQVRERLAAVGRGEGGIVSLIAEAGIGKSRLVAELAACEEASDLAWFEGRSLSTGRNLSFHAIADLLRSWAGITDDDEDRGRDKLDEALAGILGEDAPDVLPLLANLMGLPLSEEERERLDQIPGELLEKVIRGGITQLLREGSRLRPAVVVMEDLHWADLSTIELLESLLRLAADHPILFLHVFRPGFEETAGRILAFARERHAGRHLELPIRPLDPGAARRLVRNLFRGGDIPHRTRTLIEEKARGNPFYIEEVVRTLVDAGAVELRDGSFFATEKLASFEIPGTVQDAVMARIDRLPLEKKHVLQAASVIGGSFHRNVLEEVVSEAAQLDALVEGLLAGEFLVPTDRSAGVEYAFKHPLIQEVTYDAILQARRQELHLSVARATEARLPESIPGYCAMLAFHYSMGRDAERAEEYLFRAGDEAARVAASSEALHFFREASKLYFDLHGESGDPAKKALLEKNVGLALFNRGQEPESAEHFDRALEYLGARVPRSALALNARFVRDLIAVLPALYRRSRRAKPQATDLDRDIIDISFHRSVSQTTSAPTRFVFDSIATLHGINNVDPRTIPEAGAKYAGAAGIFSYSGLSFGIGQRFLDYARSLIDGEDAPDYLYFRVMSFAHHFLSGDWSKAHEIPDDLLQRGQGQGRLWEVTTYLGLLIEKFLRQGDFEAARARLEWVGEISETYEYDVARYNWVAMPVLLALEQRRLAEAVEGAERYYEESPQDLLHLLALGWKAEAEVLAGEQEAAEASLARAERLLEALGRAIPWHISGYRLARLLADVDAAFAGIGTRDARRLRRRAGRSARAAMGVADKVAYRGAPIFRAQGRRAWLAGRREEALRWWRRSLERSEALGLRPEWARTCHEIGVRFGEEGGAPRVVAGREAGAWREEAAQVYEELGLAWDLERLCASESP